MELENILSKVCQAQKAKNHMFSLICYKPKTNVVILLDMGHTKGRLYMGGKGKGKKTKNLNVVNVLTI
jgi:hypothetical protein